MATPIISREQFLIDGKGKKTGVLLSIRQYQKLLEDLHDLAVVAERRNEENISFEEMKRRLKEDGIL
jgi:hypothetical protein